MTHGQLWLEDVHLLPVFSINTYDCGRIPPDVLLSFRLQGGKTCFARGFAVWCGEAGHIGQATRRARAQENEVDPGGGPKRANVRGLSLRRVFLKHTRLDLRQLTLFESGFYKKRCLLWGGCHLQWARCFETALKNATTNGSGMVLETPPQALAW